MKKRYVFIFFILFSLSTRAQKNQAQSRVPFNLNEPDDTFKLDDKLKEISGLTWYQQNSLACINDEEGIIYILDAENGDIKQQIKFAGGADYEGITFADPFFYVTTSSGTIYQVFKEDPELQMRYDTRLTWLNDVEGLAYDYDQYRMLVACKESPALNYFDELSGKAIHQYDLQEDRMLEQPFVLLKKSDLEPFLGEKPKFKPSAIAIDPVDCNIYVLASVGKLLIVLSPDGTVIDVTTLDEKLHIQPEGIAFTPDGNLYISNEGKRKKARLYRFERK